MEGTTRRTPLRKRISRADVKVCGLCDSLNLRTNPQCFTCGWAGAFEDDPVSINAAWRGLEAEYGPLQREHVSAGCPPALREFEVAGIAACPPSRSTWRVRVTDWLLARFPMPPR